MADVQKKIKEAIGILSLLFMAGFIGIVWLMIFGNLSGNLGFATGTAGANNTEIVIDNVTGGAVTFYGFAPVLFTILAIVLLITMLVGLLYLVMKIVDTKRGGFSG